MDILVGFQVYSLSNRTHLDSLGISQLTRATNKGGSPVGSLFISFGVTSQTMIELLKNDIDQKTTSRPCSQISSDSSMTITDNHLGDVITNLRGPPARNATQLGGGFKTFLFSPLFGEMIQFHTYFADG